MAGNGNRGPNDFRGRNGRRRREPPIIDASATEVPLDAETPDPEPAEGEPASDPVLFGGARRMPEAGAPEPAADAGERPVVPSALDGEPAPGEPEPAAASTPAPEASAGGSTSHETPPAVEAAPSDAPVAETSAADAPAVEEPATPVDPVTVSPAAEAFVPPRPEETARPAAASESAAGNAVPAAAAPARSGGGAWLLGVSNLVLLGALAWVLYTGQGHDGVADLRQQVATLEARPDASKLQGDVAAIEKRLDDLAQTAQSAKADAAKASSAAGAAQSDANKPAPTGAAAPATVGALAALASRLDGVDRSVSALSTDQSRTAKAVADLPKPVPPDFGPVNARVAGLDTQLTGRLAALEGRLTAIDGKLNDAEARLNGFDAKVNAVDAKVNGSDARMNGIDARTNALEGKLDDAAAGLARLQSAVASLPKVDLGPLQAATAGLDRRVGVIEADLSAPKDGGRVTQARAVGSADIDRATPIALVGEAVQRALADGRPYGSDLDALKTLGVEPGTVARLQPFAAGGAPPAAALKARWAAVRGDVLAAVRPASPGSSALDRLADSAFSLVQVRRVGAAPGDDGRAVVSQIDAALDAGDVAGALAAWNRLPPAGQERSQDWAAAARARLDAAGAAQALVSRAIATLGSKADD